MKNKAFIKITFLLLLGVVFTHYGCKKIVTDDLTINVNTDVLVSPTAILFENAKSGATKQPTNFTLEISGKDADKVLSAIGNKTFEVQNGFIYLNLVKGVNPTVENPIVFQIKGKASGFEPFMKDVVISSNEEQLLNIKLIEEGNLPKGLIEEKTTATLQNGVFTKQEVIKTSVDDNTSNYTKLTIEPGTTMKDINGEIITGSKLDVNVRYFDPTTEAIDVFPGGLNPQNVLDEKGNEIEGGVNFISSGLMQIEMKANDKIVKNFSKPISAEMQLSPHEANPFTGEKLKQGDTIPLWSRNDITGQWKAEGTADVVYDNGILVAKFKINHLSSWNLDFVCWMPTSAIPLDVIFTTKTGESKTGNIRATMYTQNGSYITYNHFGSVKDQQVSRLPFTPNGVTVYLELTNYENGKKFKTELFNPTTKGKVYVDLTSILQTELVNVSLKYTIKCTNNKFTPKGRTFITITDLLTNSRKIISTPSMKSNTISENLKFSLVNNREYKIETIGLDGKIISYQTIFNKSNLTYSKLNGFTVNKLIFNNETQTVEADVSYITTKC
jgi:hypothetical protein